MNNGSNKGKLECAQMPEVLDRLLSPENMPHITEQTRASAKIAVARIEGSSRDSGMTCISEDDFPRVIERLRKEIDNGTIGGSSGSTGDAFSYARPVTSEQKLQGFFRGLNKHCDECLRDDCEDRVALSRREINEISGTADKYINPRQAKVQKQKLSILQENGMTDEF